MRTRHLSKALAAMLAGIICVSTLPLDTFAEAEKNAGAAMQGADASAVQAKDTDALKTGDVNADGIVDETDAKAVLSAKIKDCPQADVNADGILNQTDADMIASFISGEIGYFPVGSYYNADAGFLTRGEWIHRLAEGMQMQPPADGELNAYYTDLKDCPYADEITLAANYGVIDVMGEEFHPDTFVTRDFAAHTLNYCLGFPNNGLAITF